MKDNFYSKIAVYHITVLNYNFLKYQREILKFINLHLNQYIDYIIVITYYHVDYT